LVVSSIQNRRRIGSVRRGIPDAQVVCITEAFVKISDKEVRSSLVDLMEAQAAHSAIV
jgi:hypothetical protein